MSALIASRPRPMRTMTGSPPDAPKTRTPSAASGKSVYDGQRSARSGWIPGITRASLGRVDRPDRESTLDIGEGSADRGGGVQDVGLVLGARGGRRVARAAGG